MPRRITALRMQRNGRMITVELDGKEVLSLATSIAAGLHPDQTLEAEEIARLRRASRMEIAFARCLGLLARRPRSRAEMERYLRGRGMGGPDTGELIARLSERGWIDDQAFARVWVENRQEFRPRSRRALGMELRKFGISESDAQEAMQGIREDQAALAAARKKAARLAEAVRENPRAAFEFQRKMTAFLASRGFDYDLSRETARSVWEDLSHPVQDEKQ